MNAWNSWMGMGVKVGGIVGLIGFESTVGYVCNLGNPVYVDPITISGVRIGAGLGGGAGVVLIFIYNCGNPYASLHETKTTDWAINLSMGGKWSSAVAALKNYKVFATVNRVKGLLVNLTPGDMSNIRNCMSYIYGIYDLTDISGPKVITIDVPFAGIGEELSAFYLAGEIIIGEESIVQPGEYQDRHPQEA